MSSLPLIEIHDIKKSYTTEGVTTGILHGLSFTIVEGEFVAIMGPSGSGKSTLLHILSFLDTPSSGQYLFHGQDITGFDDAALATMRNERVGFVFQSFHLLPRTTVRENVRLPLLYAKERRGDMDQRVAEAVAAVGLAHRIDYFPHQLSGGERQRVAIARALVNDPDVVFADEPTGNLDSKSGNQILRILQDLHERGRTIVVVTHELDTAKHAARILSIRDGQLVGDEMVHDRRRAEDGQLQK